MCTEYYEIYQCGHGFPTDDAQHFDFEPCKLFGKKGHNLERKKREINAQCVACHKHREMLLNAAREVQDLTAPSMEESELLKQLVKETNESDGNC
ncbi:hypothetical protein MMC25_003181 [Agyrium rufum]|nr:hypothetical protein [Agyrium rufum]